MNNELMALMVTGIVGAIMIIVVMWFIISLTVLWKLKQRYIKDSTDLRELRQANEERIIDYSKRILEFIRMMIGQIAVIKFRTFIDNNKLDKTSKPNIEKVVQDVAKTVNEAININNISLDNTIYTKEFFEKYIIETSILMVKELLDKTLNEDYEDGGY